MIYIVIDIMIYKYLIYLNTEKISFQQIIGKLTKKNIEFDNSENSGLVGESMGLKCLNQPVYGIL